MAQPIATQFLSFHCAPVIFVVNLAFDYFLEKLSKFHFLSLLSVTRLINAVEILGAFDSISKRYGSVERSDSNWR